MPSWYYWDFQVITFFGGIIQRTTYIANIALSFKSNRLPDRTKKKWEIIWRYSSTSVVHLQWISRSCQQCGLFSTFLFWEQSSFCSADGIFQDNSLTSRENLVNNWSSQYFFSIPTQDHSREYSRKDGRKCFYPMDGLLSPDRNLHEESLLPDGFMFFEVDVQDDEQSHS